MTDLNLFRRLRSSLRNLLPAQAETASKWAYDRMRERKADRSFRRRTLPSASSSSGPQHIACVVVDALRGDFDRNAAPFVDGLDGGTAVAPAPWTYPSIASILSGRYPHEHGAIRQSDDPDRGSGKTTTIPPELSDDVTTLPEILAGAGIATFGSFGFTMPFLATQGRFHTHRLFNQVPAETVLKSYLDWREDHDNERTFAYLHLFDLHGPFEDTPPREYWRKHDVDAGIPDIKSWRYTDEWEGEDVQQYQDHRQRLYRAALDYVDDQLREFDARLRQRDNSSALVVAGDHGEAFWEMAAFDAERFVDSRPAYSVGHGGTPYEAIARVPLRGRGLPVFSGPSSLIDIAPTVLDEMGLEIPDGMTGCSHSRTVPDDRSLLVESARFGHEKKAVYREGWKLLVSRGDNQEIGFDLPDETPVEIPEGAREELHHVLPSWPEEGRDRVVSDRVQDRLEDLGYT